MKRMTWKELSNYLSEHHNKKGVIVFKQHPKWKKEHYTTEELSYVISGNEKYFYHNMISTSIWADNIAGTDNGVRLDWYMFHEDKKHRWQIDYCYLLD